VIEAGHELVQDGGAGFTDAVAVHIWLPERGSFAGLVIERRPAEAASSAAALVLAEGAPAAQTTVDDAPLVEDWSDSHAGPVTLRTIEPLRHWTAALETTNAAVDCELRAPGPPVEVTHVPGLRRYAQLATVEGRVTIGGKETRVRGQAVRTHTWGTRTEARRRFVTAIADDGAMVEVASDRPRASDAHGDELVGGEILDAQDWAGPLEAVRLSTVYGSDGLPRKAGLELYRPGDEFPARLSGEAVGGATMEIGGATRTLSFFDWSLAGRPAWGTYELESAP
jgi:hypothetical protein